MSASTRFHDLRLPGKMLSASEVANARFGEAYRSWLEHKLLLARGERLNNLLGWAKDPSLKVTREEQVELDELLKERCNELREMLGQKPSDSVGLNGSELSGLERSLVLRWSQLGKAPEGFRFTDMVESSAFWAREHKS